MSDRIIIDLPRYPIAAKIEWTPNQPSQTNRSEFTGASRTTILARAPYWMAQVSYPVIIGEPRFRPWRSALMRMQGRANAFRIVAVEGPQQRFLQRVVVDGAGQAGYLLATRGWQPGTGLRDGMLITVGEELLTVVVSTSIAGADGKLTIAVMPHLPEGVADGVAVETNLPWGLMSMTTDAPGWTVDTAQRYSISFECESAR